MKITNSEPENRINGASLEVFGEARSHDVGLHYPGIGIRKSGLDSFHDLALHLIGLQIAFQGADKQRIAAFHGDIAVRLYLWSLAERLCEGGADIRGFERPGAFDDELHSSLEINAELQTARGERAQAQDKQRAGKQVGLPAALHNAEIGVLKYAHGASSLPLAVADGDAPLYDQVVENYPRKYDGAEE